MAAGGGKAEVKRATAVSASPELSASAVAVAPEDATGADEGASVEMNGQRFTLRHGSVVIAAITSCTNT
jgi:aconitase A